ncbi:MAG: hypothetical protein JWP20_1954, partial [Roseomonas sp.]|nr:hypothetical protein [Roseomonas sp.]
VQEVNAAGVISDHQAQLLIADCQINATIGEVRRLIFQEMSNWWFVQPIAQ